MNSKFLSSLPALALALLAILLAVVGFLKSTPETGTADATAIASTAVPVPETPTFEYLVAKVALSPGDALEPEALQRIASPQPIEHAIPADQVAFGEPVAAMVRAGDVLREELLDSTSLVRPLLAPGTQAIAIPVNDVSGVGGLLKPGDSVNVYASFRDSDQDEPAAVTVLERVVVIAVRGVAYSGDAISDEERRRNASVVLAVPDNRVAALLLASNEGDIRLAALADDQVATDGAVLLANMTPDGGAPAYLRDLFPTPPPPRRAAATAPRGSKVQVFEGANTRSVYVQP